jgi:hypothetical protein
LSGCSDRRGRLGPVTITGWRTSSRSGGNGACVEAASWRTSSRSAANGNCLEAGSCCCGVAVRDSKDRGGPVLTFGTDAWRDFGARLKAGTLAP